MQRKNVSVKDIYDLQAIRVIIEGDDKHLCYQVLGIVHNLWQPISQEFDDYIARPKPNGYQSLHTAVFDDQNRTLEVQIRTRAMHERAEKGVAAHWAYKETNSKGVSPRPVDFDSKTAWLRQALELHEEVGSPNNLQEELHGYDSESRVYAFTPDGHVISVPRNATALDFAYYVHTEVGQNCLGAKINNKVAPLNTVLKNGDSVEIITSTSQRPNYGWLEFAVTSKARNKIKNYLQKKEKDESIKIGEQLFVKSLRRLKMINQANKLRNTFSKFGLNTVDQLFESI